MFQPKSNNFNLILHHNLESHKLKDSNSKDGTQQVLDKYQLETMMKMNIQMSILVNIGDVAM